MCVYGAPPLCLSSNKNVGLRYLRVSPFRLVPACTARTGQPQTGRAETATCCSAGPNQASATCTARYGTPRCTAAGCQEREVWHCHSYLHYYSGTATCRPIHVPWVTDPSDAVQDRSCVASPFPGDADGFTEKRKTFTRLQPSHPTLVPTLSPCDAWQGARGLRRRS